MPPKKPLSKPPKLKKPPPAAKPAAVWVHVDHLTPWAKNPRVNAAAIPKVRRSIERFGFPSTMIARADTNDLVAGHTRLLAMRAILADHPKFKLEDSPGPGYVPVRQHRFKSDAEAYAYALADNRLSEDAQWDEALLHEVVSDIQSSQEFNDDMGVMGFEGDELESILAGPPIVTPPEPPSTPTGLQQRDPNEGASQLGGLRYRILIECANEHEQGALLERLEREGLKCEPLIS